MGLDMYLTKRHYVKNWGHMKPEEKHTISVLKNNKPVEEIDTDKISEIIVDVAYWRKANAIHKWFVDNVQDGDDDCGDHYVSHENLQELLDTVNKVIEASVLVEGKIINGYSYTKEMGEVPNYEDGKIIENPEVADELLPTTKGFFFGGTSYDEYYYQDLVDTKKAIEEALKSKSGEFYYNSSW